MAILDTILSTPVDTHALRATGASKENQLDGAFANLLYYARYNWHYTASGNTGGADLLAGTATQSPCGGIATALKLVFINGLGVADTDVEYIRLTGYVWTGPEYLCFDAKVIGNLRHLDGKDYRNGCIFNEHYYLKCNNKYYDPCLSTAYLSRDQSVKERFQGAQSMMAGANRKLLYTSDRKTGILYMPSEKVNGFQGAWAMFPLSRKNIEKAMGARDFKAELQLRGGTTGFATFVNGLH